MIFIKKIILTIFFLCIAIGITGCSNFGGNVENVSIKEIDSNIYTKEDIANAINTIIKEFDKNWDRCTLKEIYYSGDDNSLVYQDWADRNDADEVIVLLSTFDTDSKDHVSLNSNSTYENWNWILVRNKGEKWIHVDHGY